MDPVVLLDADHYARQLEEQGGVIAGFAARHGELLRQLQVAAAKEGLTPIDDDGAARRGHRAGRAAQRAAVPASSRSSWPCRRSASS